MERTGKKEYFPSIAMQKCVVIDGDIDGNVPSISNDINCSSNDCSSNDINRSSNNDILITKDDTIHDFEFYNCNFLIAKLHVYPSSQLVLRNLYGRTGLPWRGLLLFHQ